MDWLHGTAQWDELSHCHRRRVNAVSECERRQSMDRASRATSALCVACQVVNTNLHYSPRIGPSPVHMGTGALVQWHISHSARTCASTCAPASVSVHLPHCPLGHFCLCSRALPLDHIAPPKPLPAHLQASKQSASNYITSQRYSGFYHTIACRAKHFAYAISLCLCGI